MKKNILIITVRADFGGGPEHINNIIPWLKKEYNVFIASPDDFPYQKRFIDQVGNNNYIKIPHRKFKLSVLFKLRKFVKENNISIIHSHGKGAGIYSRPLAFITAAKCIHTFHGIHIGRYSSVQVKLYLLLEQLLSRFTNRFVCVSYGERRLAENLRICQARKIVVIENGVNTEGIIKALPPGQEQFGFLHISRFDEQKNTELLVKIAVELKKIGLLGKVRFVIVGDGERRAKIELLTREAGVEEVFSFEGFQKTPARYFEEANGFITTSLWEGMPLAVLEAMSYGLPVIASNVVGNNDIVESGTDGLLYDVNNPKDAAEKIKQLMDSYRLWNSFSENAAEKIEKRYSKTNMGENHLKLYNELNEN